MSEDIEGVDSDDGEQEMNDEDSYCEDQYVIRNTKRDDDGRLNVSLSFKNGKWPELGDSRKSALKTLFQLEKKIRKNT